MRILIYGHTQIFDYLCQNDMFRFDDTIAFVSDRTEEEQIKFRNEWLDVISIEMTALIDFDYILFTEELPVVEYNKFISMVDNEKLVDWRNYFESVVLRKMKTRYQNCTDIDVLNTLKYMSENGVQVFNGEFTKKYDCYDIDVQYDDDNQMFYVIYDNKKMYMKRSYTDKESVKTYVKSLLLEQDPESPHCYFNGRLNVNSGAVVIDAGVAEGNFALSIIDNVSRIYLIECDSEWMEALKLTMQPYKDKVVFCQKMLSDHSDESTICIDDLIESGEKVNFIKFDVEGFEIMSLIGARKTISASDDFQCAICSYHKHGDQILIESLLHDMGVKTYNTNGYMFFKYEEGCFVDPELRRGLVQGIKVVRSDD